MEKEALFYEKQGEVVNCKLCPHNCHIPSGAHGICNVRVNSKGKLYTINYGEITSMAQDPIEKKPLYHFKPGSNILSVGSFGCNFSCGFCQNYSISQGRAKSEYVAPEKLVEICKSLEGNIGIAFTYNEPSIWYEYVYNSSKLLKERIKDINIVVVTNGYIKEEPLKILLPYVDAMNIDLKALNNKYYKDICGGSVTPVMDTIKIASKQCHAEVTTLLVNGENDSAEEIGAVAGFIASLNKDIPLHLSRYFPNYKMNNPATKVEVMFKDRDIAKKYLNYVYLGNIADSDNSTYCPKCGYKIIERDGKHINVNTSDSVCPKCGYKINIVL
ncbi:AmmeMemoRadiSam system radical SAM enzyme [Clostridium tagluense]|uniref:AmmeMemoRadiSam system radical SAM enzyme n=1 Tax=Clostridium tagluense TaxID=360422 RepID=UPI001C6EA354|nr:AmmeMemoRadiSam system radical SAM enzyme [Clostridium tagluense]MBW9157861.1 AmmeMemoRadiSam system radical SAM enzyme [Clostridium tagluense]WLC67062.1 AmmeMemoRadiSam system radical SAM enzyme [Clostridium tagluense]